LRSLLNIGAGASVHSAFGKLRSCSISVPIHNEECTDWPECVIELHCCGGSVGYPVRLLIQRKTSPLSIPPPRSTRFGSPLVLSRVHWVEPKLVAEITYLTWTADNLLRHTVYVGLREDKPASEVRR
jgi:hypothetical protein